MDTTSKVPILLVDDDTFLLDMYSVKFSKNGFDVKTASSADDALKLIRGGYAPHIMLVDVIMPGMTGLEMVEVIRKEKLVPKTLIIMLTNQGFATDIERAKNLNVNGYIIKATSVPSEVLTEVQKIYTASKK